jgi:formylmethanofuran--tetrahydromethanopterin N-formyltransferase
MMEDNVLEIVKYDEGLNELVVRHRKTGNITSVVDTFAEMFPMWVSRVLITAETSEWAMTAAQTATGFASSIIFSPAEAGIEKTVPSSETPDGRPGVLIQIYHTLGYALKAQMINRIGQCVMTCPTTAAYNALTDRPAKLLRVGKSISLFGDGYQTRDVVSGRKVWRIPVMEGEFIVEERFAVKRGVAGGMFLILAKDKGSGLAAAEAAVKAIKRADNVVLPFPGGVCRSGSKVGSVKYKLPASTNHQYCPTLRSLVQDTMVPEGVSTVYEVVVNGLDAKSVKMALAEGIQAAAAVEGVIKISAANYGGKLGPYKLFLKDLIG